MKDYLIKFIKTHGERLFYMGIATVMAVCFIVAGIKIPALKEFLGAGNTILIGIAMLCYNKARGNGKEPEKPNIESK